MEFVKSATFRRLLISILGTAAIALNKKLGLGLEMSDTAEIAALVIAYVTGSNVKEAHIAGKEAEQKVTTMSDAAAVFTQTPANPPIASPTPALAAAPDEVK